MVDLLRLYGRENVGHLGGDPTVLLVGVKRTRCGMRSLRRKTLRGNNHRRSQSVKYLLVTICGSTLFNFCSVLRCK